jgi:hypothetical protein
MIENRNGGGIIWALSLSLRLACFQCPIDPALPAGRFLSLNGLARGRAISSSVLGQKIGERAS